MMSLPKLLDRMVEALTGVSRIPRSWEALLLKECEDQLRRADRIDMASQVAAVGRFNRVNEDRMVLVWDRSGHRMAGYGGEDECLFSGQLTNQADVRVVGRIFAYAGGVHRFEFSPSPRQLGDGPLGIRIMPSRKSVASIAGEIDREEHDDNDERED